MKSKIRLTAFIGILAGLGVVWFGVLSGTARHEIFWDHHALILVLGGTFAAAFIAYPLRQFQDLWSFVTAGALFPTEKGHERAIEHLLMVANRPLVAKIDPEIRLEFHPFFLEGYTLMQKQEWTPAEYKMILHGRIQRFKERYGLDAKALAALAKFPPAFGLLGATSGMIAMMSNLGPDARDNIGPAMAIALVATFWGIALANLVLLPLADHAARMNAEDARLRLMIATGLALIHQGARPSALYEHLVAFIPVGERENPKLRQALNIAESQARIEGRVTDEAS
jgi:chemotaxis protein MotA